MSSTTAGSSNSSRYLDFDEYVDLKLQKTRSTIKTTDILVALAGVAAMFLGYLLVFVVCDQWVVPGGFSIGLRWTLLLTLLVLTAAWLAWKVGVPYLRSVNRLYAAHEIEKADPDLKSNLLNLIDLRDSGRVIDPAILRALEKNAATGLQRVDVGQAIDHRPLMQMAYILLAVVLAFSFYALLTPKNISNSIWRSLFPSAAVKVATQTEIVNVHPGNVTVLARQSVEFSADISGEVPEKVWLLYSTSDGRFQNEPVELRTDGDGPTRFKGIVPNLLQDLTYVVRAGDATSQSYRITVDQPPSAMVDRVQFEFPAYTKLERLEQAGGQIDTWEGTRVTITAHTNLPVKTAKIEFLDEPGKTNGEEITMSVAGGRQLTATWTLGFRSDGTFAKSYQIQCTTESGANDPTPVPYAINVRPDLPPDVAFLEPVRNLEVPANVMVPLLIEARDPDFELSHINLHIRKNGQILPKEPLSEGRQQRLLLKHDLHLDRYVLKTGDQVEIWVQAFDNKQPRNNSKSTPELKLTIVEPISEAAAKQKQAEDTATREQRLDEAKQEQNSDGKDPMPGDSAPDGRPRDPQRPEDKPMPPMPQPENAAANGDKQEPGASGNSSSKSEPGQTGTGKNPDPQNKKDEPASQEPSPSPDGEDDRQVLEQLIKDLAKPNEQAGGDQGTDQKQDSTSKADKSTEPNPGEPKAEEQPSPNPDSTQQESPKPGSKETKPAKPSNPDEGTEKSQTKKPDPSKTKSEPGKDSTPQPNEADNPADPQQGPKPDPEKPSPEGPKDPKPGADSKEKKEKTEGTKPAPKPEPGTNPEAKPGAPKPEDKPDAPGNPGKDEPMPGGQKPMPGEKDPKQGPGQESPKPGDPSGTQGTDPMPATEQKPMKNAPAADSEPGAETKPANKPGPDAPKSRGPADGEQEPVENAKDPEQKPATGKENGVGKPDTDPRKEATQSTNPDLKRDPREKPATRPGETRPKETTDPANRPSDNEVKPPTNKAPRTDEGKLKPDQQETPQQQPGKNEQKRQGTPNAAKTPKPEEGKKDQHSKDATGGTGGSSKQDSTGDPGSKDPGEGDKVKKPGTQEAADKKSESGSDETKPGDKKDGEGGQDAAGGEQESNQPGKSPKPGSGKETGGKPSDGGGEGAGKPQGEPGQGKPGATGGKPGSGSGKTGPTGGGGGTPGGENAPAANPGSSDGAVDGDEANLEYNKQATELVLKRLQSTLERGDVDPELLKKLGWTQDELQRFTERLAKQLEDAKAGEDTPESIARRQQFEEMLKTLKPNKQGVTQKSDHAVQRDANLIDSRRTTVPREYRNATERLSRELTRQKPRK
ncbi:MAG: hypothetical protein JSS49_07075 [Planctomycetes bacterium]|nr:hypothetical protein [Planctomycetota bacterium]